MPNPLPPRARLVAATEDMLRESGMSGTGIKEVVARSGAPIGSLYHYFPGGKTQLVTEALGSQGEKACRLMQRFFEGEGTAAAAVRTLFDTAAEGFERAGANKGCAIGAVALDLATSDEEIRSVCRETLDQWMAVIAPRLPFRDVRSRRSFAMTIVAAFEGAFILGRAARSGDPFRAVGESLAALMPAPARKKRKARRR